MTTRISSANKPREQKFRVLRAPKHEANPNRSWEFAFDHVDTLADTECDAYAYCLHTILSSNSDYDYVVTRLTF